MFWPSPSRCRPKFVRSLINNIIRPVSGTLIDHICTSNHEHVLRSAIIEIGLSDPIYITRKVNPHIFSNQKYHQTITYRRTKHLNVSRFCSDLDTLSSTTLEIVDSPDDQLEIFYEHFTSVLNNHAPLIKKRVESKKRPGWFCEEIRIAQHNRDYNQLVFES
jgi:hypothetical protein